MTQNQRIDAFVALGELIGQMPESLQELIERAAYKNHWYTVENSKKQLAAIAENLQKESLTHWLSQYPAIAGTSSKKVGLILAGNIPLVGFHDILAVLIAGFTAQIKLSSDDAGLTPFLLESLIALEPAFASKIEVVDRLAQFDLIIATGSDNSARYFEHYFGKQPHIIRKNRNSVAILTGKETKEELHQLGADIFDYFGLGCRSVSKCYVPEGYDVAHLYEGITAYEPIRDHYKYSNNYDYNKSIYLINRDKHFDNGFLLLKEDEKLASPLAVVFYETYKDLGSLTEKLNAQADKIQCIVSQATISSDIPTFRLGGSQCPSLTDYADGVDTMAFLSAQY